MFSEKLENLIKVSLQDGVLTDQEKASIIKRAQTEGEDIDEVEIYIQSLKQKRQQELSQKNKEALAVQAKEAQIQEKERAEKLRKCPKCGEYIPHMTSICPECGFIIDKTGVEDNVVFLISLLKECLNRGFFLWEGHTKLGKSYVDIQITKKQFDAFPNCFSSKEEKDSGIIEAKLNYSGIISEASLYKDNKEISSLITQLKEAEVKLYYDDAIKSLKKPTDDNLDKVRKCLSTFKSNYSDVAMHEIASLEEKLTAAEAFSKTLVGKLKKYQNWIIAILVLLVVYFFFFRN